MRVKRRIFAGSTCDQTVYFASDRAGDIRKKTPRVRFQTEEEREEFNRRISRRKHARLINENMTTEGWFGTLTFDREHECHEFEDAYRERDNYYRRLRRCNPDAVIFLYVGKGKSTSRIHLHIICLGFTREEITSRWTCGEVKRLDHLREHNYMDGVDLGADFTAVANYCFDHWTSDQPSKHRYKATKNLRQPDDSEKPTEAKVDYSPKRPPIPPKGFRLAYCEYNKFGYMCFHYVREPERKRAFKNLVNV